ncbi:5305_t:CDS:2 [Cetraspora pellucida]|uniref:5305_t:CDS:1 n=1 Tax=Cetraspora pellucida TaxID=1433469 RepID=A0ACA9LLQ7_9GLOM|nr:5305_t:CDS:2 [Cetraspora pellucida]
MNGKNASPKPNENPWDEFFAPIWESATPKQRTRPSNGKDAPVGSIKSQGSANLKKIGGKSVSPVLKKLEPSISKSASIIKSKRISEPPGNKVNRSINKGNGTINRLNDMSHNDVSKVDLRRKAVPDLSLKYPKAVPCSLEEIIGEPIFPNSKKPDPDIKMPSSSKKDDSSRRENGRSKKEDSNSKKEDSSGKKEDSSVKKEYNSIKKEYSSSKKEYSNGKKEESVSVSTHHKPKDLTHLKTLKDYQREAEAMGHKLPSERDPPNTIYYPRIKRLLDPASLKLPITNPNHPMNVIKYLSTVPPRPSPVQLNKLARTQNSNFVTNKSASKFATKSQIHRPSTEKKVPSLSKTSLDTRRTSSKSITELHKTSNIKGEKRTPRELSIARDSPQTRDKIHLARKELLQSTGRKRIAHEEYPVRDPSNIKRRLTNNTLSPTQQMSKKRTMHLSPEPSRPSKRQHIRNREDNIDETNVSSIIQSIFRPSAMDVFNEEARSSKIARKEDEEQERLDQQRRLLKAKRHR